MTTTRKTIIEAAARAAFVSAWADYMEEKGEAHGWGGQDLMDVAPKTPSKARVWARRLVALMEKFNGHPIEYLYIHAGGNNARDFGHYMAMEALGHGVAWADDHKPHGYRIPHAEFHCFGGARSCEGYVSERPEIGSDG